MSITSVRLIVGYGAIAGTLPYLALKAAWLSGSTIGITDPATAHDGSLFALNLITAGMDVIAILVALAFTYRWGQRLPAGLHGIRLAGPHVDDCFRAARPGPVAGGVFTGRIVVPAPARYVLAGLALAVAVADLVAAITGGVGLLATGLMAVGAAVLAGGSAPRDLASVVAGPGIALVAVRYVPRRSGKSRLSRYARAVALP